MKISQSFVLIAVLFLSGCNLRQDEGHVDRVFGNEVTLVQVQPDQEQRIVVDLENRASTGPIQIIYQQLDAVGEVQESKKLELGEVLNTSAVYRGLHPVSFGSVLFGFVLLASQDDGNEMQGFLFVWNGTSWHYDPKTRVLLDNLTDANEVDGRLGKVFPHNGLSSSIKLMTVKDLQFAREMLGDVFFPETRVVSKHGKELLILTKMDTGSESVFLLEQFAGGMNVYRLPSPMDSVIPQTCRPVEAGIKQCGVNAVTSLSMVYNCQSPVHNQSENEANIFESQNESWVLQSQTSCDQ
ncbi:hypothetical protein [Limnobacter sp.]|uniref:hypothetical protein n=1 Tax=Limnobacter sp. TaxID=2003368 RepID=UPI002FE41417